MRHNQSTGLSIVVADDSAFVREALIERLRNQYPMAFFKEISTSRKLLAVNSSSEADLLLVSLTLPDLQGWGGLRALKTMQPDAAIVAIDCPDDPGLACEALRMGLAGFIPRSSSDGVFAAAMAAIVAGEPFFPPRLIARALLLAEQIKAADMHYSKLTPRQRQVLGHVVHGLPNKAIARLLAINEITVKVHLADVFLRLGVTNRTQAAVLAERSGWFIDQRTHEDEPPAD